MPPPPARRDAEPGPRGADRPDERGGTGTLRGGRGVPGGTAASGIVLGAALWLAGIVSPGASAANVADMLGLGSRAVALGGAYTALADDFSSLYYNPAGLAAQRESSLTVGGLWARPELHYREGDGPEVHPHLFATGGLYLGVATNLGHLTGYDQLAPWTLGICLYSPVERALLADIPSRSSEKKFIFYLDQTQVMVFMIGLSWRITDWLSVGASGNFLADLRAPNEAFVDVNIWTVVPYLAGISDLEKEVRPRIMRDTEMKASPIVGVKLEPLQWLTLGMTYRGRFYAETVGSQDILLRFADPSGATGISLQSAVLASIHYVHFWTPHQVSGGVAFRPVPALRIAVDLTWADWSKYRDPMWYVPEIRFHDTWTPRLGVEYAFGNGFALRAGYAFEPSPVPEQTRSSNYLDCDRHVGSVGVGYTFPRLPWIPLWKKPLTLEGFFQYTGLVSRTYRKAPGYGGSVGLGGYMLHAGASLTLHF